MFRITKSNDQLKHRDPKDEAADRCPSSNRPAQDQQGDASSEDLVLTEPLGAFDQVDDQEQVDSSPFFDFDDDDDIDDFDDLGVIDSVAPPPAIERTTFFPDIELSDTASLDDLDDPVVLDPGLVDPAAELVEAIADPPQADEPDLKPEITKLTDTFPAEVEPIRPQQEPLASPAPSSPDEEPQKFEPDTAPTPTGLPQVGDELLRAQPFKDELDAPPVTGTSLAMQPIPELQTGPKPKPTPTEDLLEPSGLSQTTRSLVEPSEGFAEIADDESLNNQVDEVEPELLLTEDDDLDPSTSDPMLEIEPLDIDLADQADHQIEGDWHAHLADMLSGEDDRQDPVSLAPPEPESEAEPEKTPLPSRTSDPLSVLPLSKTLTQLATGNLPDRPDSRDTESPDSDEDDPKPPVLSSVVLRKAAVGEPATTTCPFDITSLSQEQLTTAVIANVPRLRRFAAAQISDDAAADQLVQTTIVAALTNSAALEPSSDLGLGLMTLLHRRRRESRKKPGEQPPTDCAIRAFETALCHGLAGADQFEIREFARAITSLEEQDRELLIWVALENLNYRQIADIVDISASEMMTKVALARARLRLALTVDDLEASRNASAVDDMRVREIEIHGYLDGELDDQHMAYIDTLVEHNEEAADQILHYGIQGDLIRRLYAPLLNRPIPTTMLDALSAAAKPARRSFFFGPRKARIAGALLIALGVGLAWHSFAPALDDIVPEAWAISSSASKS